MSHKLAVTSLKYFSCMYLGLVARVYSEPLSVVTLCARIPAILADMLVLWVTWHKTGGLSRRRDYRGAQMPITSLLLRDGEH